ncbi:PAS domain S-box protein [Shewanella atlantica]|uniref:PAS domain S-box protein n=2 Tax=Shewanella TaxID=22 RepID=UPI0037353FA2
MLKTPQNLQHMVDAIHACVAVVEQHKDEFIILACNERFKEMLGETPSFKPYSSLNSILCRSVTNTLLTFLPQVFISGEPLELEQAFEQGEKSNWWRLFLKPMEQPHGHLKRVMITGINMDDKIALETEINKSGARYSSVVKGAFDAIITMDRFQTINYFNRAAENVFEYRADEVIGKPITCLMPVRHREHHAEYVEEFASEDLSSRDMGERIQIYGLKKSGVEFAAEISISKIKVEG